MDAARTVAAALAVRDGRIVAVGSDAAVGRWIGPRTPGRRAPRPDRDARASVTPTSIRSAAGVGRLRCDLEGAARARCLPRRDRRLRRGPPGRAVDRRRRLVDGGLPGRHPRSRPTSTGSCRTGRSTSRAATATRPGSTAGRSSRGRDRRRQPRPGRRAHRARRRRPPDRRPPGGGDDARRAAAARDDRRRARRRAPARPGRAPRPRDHPLAGRDRPARVRRGGLHDAGRAGRADRPGRRGAVVGPAPRRRADRRARRAARADRHRPVRADERQAHAGRRPRELHRRPSSSRISTRPAARPRNVA